MFDFDHDRGFESSAIPEIESFRPRFLPFKIAFYDVVIMYSTQ